MKIQRKLIIAFIMPILAIGLFGLAGFLWDKKMFIEASDISTMRIRTELMINEANNALSRYAQDYALLYEPDDVKNFQEVYAEQTDLLKVLNSLTLSDEEKQYVDKVNALVADDHEVQAQIFKVAEQIFNGLKYEKSILYGAINPVINKWLNTLNFDDPTGYTKSHLLLQIQINTFYSIIKSKYHLELNEAGHDSKEIYGTTDQLLDYLSKTNLSSQEIVWLNDLRQNIGNLLATSATNNKNDEALNDLLTKDSDLAEQIDGILDDKLYKIAFDRDAVIENAIKVTNIVLIVSIISLILVGMFLSLLFAKLLIRPLEKLIDTINKLRAGEVVEVTRQSNDEIGDLSEAFGGVVKDYASHTSEISAQGWLKEHITEILKMAQAEKTLEDMCNVVVAKISELLNAGCGAFYITREDNTANKLLVLLGTYGYKKRKNISSQFKFGESIVGQAALEGKLIILSEIPEDYIHITSGLGNKHPNYIIVLPIKLENNTLGVMELALFHKITEIQQQFLEQLSNNLAVVIEAILNRQQAENAFQSLQKTAEELQTQQEELRTTNEELEEKTHILQKSEEELKTQGEEMQASNEELAERMRAIETQKHEIQKKNSELETIKQELELKANDLVRAGKYKTEFLANMSHELRTPLNSLLLLSSSFAKNEDGNLTPDQIEQANIIHKGGKDLLTLINDILDLSKVEAGKLNIQIEDANVNEIIQDLKTQFEPVITNKGLQFNIQVAPQITGIKTDAYRVKQILRNLLSNAVKFTSTGMIKLDITLSTDQKNIIFKVIDTGIGIEKQKFNDIFEAFQQAYGDTDRTYGGTGLGLTISKKLAKLLGGEITLESEFGKGSTFALTLPCNAVSNFVTVAAETVATAVAVPPAPSPPPVPPVENTTTKNVIIIEKNDNIIATLKQITEKKGYNGICVKDATTAMALILQVNPEGIILDLSPTENDNFTNQLQANAKTKNIPVHTISNNGLEGALDFLNPKAAGNLPILLVEDNMVTQNAICRSAAAKNISIIAVGTGAAGIEKLTTGTFSGLILDLNLPDISGFEVLKIISAKIERLPPIIIYSERDLTPEEYEKLNQYTTKIILKEGDVSLQRLLDECSLFLHNVEKNSNNKATNITMVTQPDAILRGKEILLVDDDMRNVYALSMILKRQGIIVTVATNGADALRKLEAMKNVDLIIMDIMMPVLDGYEAMRRIRKDVKYKNTPIIAVTAKAMPDDKKASLEAGANEYITKPIDADKLLTMMRIWLSVRKS